MFLYIYYYLLIFRLLLVLKMKKVQSKSKYFSIFLAENILLIKVHNLDLLWKTTFSPESCILQSIVKTKKEQIWMA